MHIWVMFVLLVNGSFISSTFPDHKACVEAIKSINDITPVPIKAASCVEGESI